MTFCEQRSRFSMHMTQRRQRRAIKQVQADIAASREKFSRWLSIPRFSRPWRRVMTCRGAGAPARRGPAHGHAPESRRSRGCSCGAGVRIVAPQPAAGRRPAPQRRKTPEADRARLAACRRRVAGLPVARKGGVVARLPAGETLCLAGQVVERSAQRLQPQASAAPHRSDRRATAAAAGGCVARRHRATGCAARHAPAHTAADAERIFQRIEQRQVYVRGRAARRSAAFLSAS